MEAQDVSDAQGPPFFASVRANYARPQCHLVPTLTLYF